MRKVETEITKNDLKNITTVIEQASAAPVQKKFLAHNAQERRNRIKVIQQFLDEYLDNYILVGFAPNGEEIITNRVHSAKDCRSLNDLLAHFSREYLEMQDSSVIPGYKEFKLLTEEIEGMDFEDDDDFIPPGFSDEDE